MSYLMFQGKYITNNGQIISKPPPPRIYDLYSFGYNITGQLGMDTDIDYEGVIQTPPFEDIKQVTGGLYHTFILFNDGTVKSFGHNGSGALGMGNKTDYGTSIQSPAFNNVKQIACGGHYTFLLFDDGTVKSFGQSGHGQLGMGDNTTGANGVIVTPPFNNVKSVYCGSDTTFLLFNDGTVKSFGSNYVGMLASGDTTSGALGAIVTPAFNNVKQIAVSGGHTVLLLDDGTVRSCGNNQQGQLGMGDTTSGANGVIVTPPFNNVKSVYCGSDTTFLLFNDGTFKSFGSNEYGQLGMGNLTNYAGAIQDPLFTNVKSIGAGASHFFIVLNDGTVRSFGLNDHGQLGMGNTTAGAAGVIETPAFTDPIIGFGSAFCMVLN